MTDISLGFVYRKGNPYLNNMRAQVNMRKLFFVALPRQLGVTVEYYGSPDVLDLKHVADKHDAWLFFDAVGWGIPKLLNWEKLRGPKFCHIGDSHGAAKVCPVYGKTKLEQCREFAFDAYFFQHHPEYFYRFFPRDWTYWWVPMGVDWTLYNTHSGQPWELRRKDKVLLTGVDGPEYYPLRTRLRHDARIHYNQPGGYQGDSYSPGQYDGERYPVLLGQWRASVASGYSILNKCFEVAAGGCLNLIEVTEDNGCGLIGYQDGKTAVFITPQTASDKIDEFLADADNPRWQQIATAGREFVLNNYTHMNCAARLVEHIRRSL